MKTELISHTHGADNFLEVSAEDLMIVIARESSEREDKLENTEKLTQYLIDNKHWSPFEHAHMGIRITTSRAIAAQFLRHRSFAFQELSQRYAVVGEQEPLELRKQCGNNRQSSSEVLDDIPTLKLTADLLLQDSVNKYHQLIRAGVARECARMVLPMNTQTRLIMTGSVRSWVHFFDVRCDEHAQKEARDIALKIRDGHFKRVYPKVWEAIYGSNKVNPSKETQETTDKSPIKIGDTVVALVTCGDYFKEGDVGIAVLEKDRGFIINFNNQGNPYVHFHGKWFAQSCELAKVSFD
jgi:thymidylate synthase (FAD)